MSGILNIGNIQANTAGAATTFVPITAFGGFQNQVIAANGVQYMCHVFTQSGTWTVSATGSSNEVEYLVVGGGGGGGMDMGGGGGGGQAVYGKTTVSVSNYGVTVGVGGQGAPAGGGFRTNGTGGQQPTQHQFTVPGTGGDNSQVFGVTGHGGGFGGSSYYDYTPGASGQNSSGGGGGTSGYSNGSQRDGGTGNYPGGRGGGQYYSGGGGGAGTPGTPSTLQSAGGAGLWSNILGVGYYWGGGGGGSGHSIWGGSGGLGGGGGGAIETTYGGRGFNNGSPGGGGGTNSQANKPGGNGGPNTGGGGGGGSHYNSTNKGGDGGSGIVIIRYPLTGPTTEQPIACTNGSAVAVPGTILQTVFVRTDRQFLYNATSYNNGGASGGTPIGELGLTITPKRANSLLLVRWMINGEMQHDTVFTINRDGALVTTDGYEGYNEQAGGFVPWSGIITGKYDRNDVSSTENNWFLQYWVPAGSTKITTLYPAVRSSTYGSNQTLYLNRTAGNSGQDSHEVAVSTGYIMEIAQ